MAFRFPRLPLRIWLALGGLALMAVPVVSALPRYTTSSSAYCSSCHSTGDIPDRTIASKVHPDFDQVTCVDCHGKPGQFIYDGYRKGFMAEPERVGPQCLRCHEDIVHRNDQADFKFNVMDIKVPHKLHAEMGARCVDCHANVAHDLKEPQTNRPRMEYCAQCHAATTEACTKCHGAGVPPGPIPISPPAGMVADGTTLFIQHCAECHSLKGDRIAGADLSSSDFLAARGFFALEKLATEGHGGMPAFGMAQGGPLTDDEIRAIIAHLKLVAEGPVTANGEALYARDCLVCHGEKGDKVVAADLSSVEFLDSLGDEGIIKAISEGRGGMPGWGIPHGGPLSYDEIVAVARYTKSLAGTLAGLGIVPHRIEGLDHCLECHGRVGPEHVPPSHEGRTNEECLICHQPTAISGAPTIPHRVSELADCLLCHDEEGVRPVPATHQGQPNESCLRCHQAVSVIAALDVPHGIEGRDDCLACHAEGGPKPAPADHKGRINEACLLCHEAPTAEAAPSALAPSILHSLESRGDCLLCHSESGVKPMPANHKNLINEQCTLCHKLAP
ncbi:MAG: c-type cytochrome [Anaerolineales bacterium]|nr:MAG: c-type cytochrome [Anaerolineales bacterium]